MSRKDMLRAMFGAAASGLPDGNPPAEAPAPPAHRRAGAVGAMSRSLHQMAEAADRARALVASGATVVDLDPAAIDPSFIGDRLGADEAGEAELRRALLEDGQRSPILARPHPDSPGRYQIVFGHRRARILAGLGRPVRAIVQELTDEELVVAQGQENAARADLSYIERARFALALEERGFDRRVLMRALGMEKTQLSRLLALGRALDSELVAAIGPAPKAGRPRWAALAERLAALPERGAIEALLASPKFRESATDARFAAVFAAAAAPAPAAPRRVFRDNSGRRVATIERAATRMALIIEDRDAPAFAAFLESMLPELYARHLARADLPAPEGAPQKD